MTHAKANILKRLRITNYLLTPCPSPVWRGGCSMNRASLTSGRGEEITGHRRDDIQCSGKDNRSSLPKFQTISLHLFKLQHSDYD